jgi:antitoxin (DNA-binding transcriptional repressor) of toxin-antitoxin stability system
MTVVTIEEAQARLLELIQRLNPGDELIITHQDAPIARLAPAGNKRTWPCKSGSASGRIRIAENFDDPLEGFEDDIQ